MRYISRFLERRVIEALAAMPAVFVNGPRQAGKSTLARKLVGAMSDAHYATFDDIETYASASNDPAAFLRAYSKPAIIDEVQMVPEIARALKRVIDERRASGEDANGRFLLTGSANVLALPELSQALVGRLAVLSLCPFAASEVLGHGKSVINAWFDQRIATASEDKVPALSEAVRRATFPEISGAARGVAAQWFSGYLTTLLQRDIRQLADIENIRALPDMVRILAARAAGLLNDADCARDAKLNTMTYRRYRALLQQVFLISLVPSWHRNIAKRVAKAPKLFFTDTGLLCHVLGTDVETLRRQNPPLFGRIVENFVASELAKQLTVVPDATLHHFRTLDGSEVDFVIERLGGRLIGVEVKSASTVTASDFAGLKTLKAQAGRDFVRGVVIYLGKQTLPFGDDMVAMPLDALWRFNVEISTDRELRTISGRNVAFWADYGDATRVRCLIPREIVHDHFRDRASDAEAISAVRTHWNVVWPILERKIADGRMETVTVENPQQEILQAVLEESDLANRDFR